MTPQPLLDLSIPGRYHVVGVGGPGMNALALVLQGMGHAVSGSDVRESAVVDRLRQHGVVVTIGHDPQLVQGTDAVTASTAIPRSNAEIAAAVGAGIPMLSRAGMLGSICAQAKSLGVAGTHGKTTTTSMLTTILREAGWDPSFIVGGDAANLGTGGLWTSGEWLVVEADESDATFLELPLAGAIVTNVEADHLENWGTFDAIVAGFERFVLGVDGPVVVCIDDAVARTLTASRRCVTYGTDLEADYRVATTVLGPGFATFMLVRHRVELGEITVPLRGMHNVRNAAGAIALAMEVGVPFADAASGLARFGGVARRFDHRGTVNGITFIDDYAHIPTEIAVVLEAARSSGDSWSRVVAVFQPNRFRRMAVLSPEYAHCFAGSNLAVITEIYPSGDVPIPGVTGKLVVHAILDSHPFQRVAWIAARSDLVTYLATELRAGDVCISMGCGDIETLPDEVIAQLQLGVA